MIDDAVTASCYRTLYNDTSIPCTMPALSSIDKCKANFVSMFTHKSVYERRCTCSGHDGKKRIRESHMLSESSDRD